MKNLSKKNKAILSKAKKTSKFHNSHPVGGVAAIADGVVAFKNTSEKYNINRKWVNKKYPTSGKLNIRSKNKQNKHHLRKVSITSEG